MSLEAKDSTGALQDLAVDTSGRAQVTQVDSSGGALGTQQNPIATTPGSSAVAAFGESLVAVNTPIIQVDFPYGVGNARLVSDDSTASGSVTYAASMVTVASGAASSSVGQMNTTRYMSYRPGQGAMIRFTALFTAGVAGNTQIVGYGDDNDGYFFGYNGTAFGVLRRQNGSDTWVAQTAWSEDVMDGTGDSGVTLDQTKGNVYQINFQYLGFGVIDFFVENPSTGLFVRVHRIEYPNANTAPSIYIPQQRLRAESNNDSNSTDITVKVASMMGAINGEAVATGPRNSHSGFKSGVTNSEVVVFNLRNKSGNALGGSVTNHVPVLLQHLKASTAGNKSIMVRAYVNATIGGSPSWADIDTNTSVMEVDTAGTASGGYEVASIPLASDGQAEDEMAGVELMPGDVLTITAIADSSGGTNTVGIGVHWEEQQ